MKSLRVIIADESPAMRQWYAAGLARLSGDVEECENGLQLIARLAEERPFDLVVASKWLPGISGAQILAILRTAEARVPFVLVSPFCDGSVRVLVDRLPDAALVDDPLDAVALVEAAESLLSACPAEHRPERQLSAARVLRAHQRSARARRPRRIRSAAT
jgi:DNA-binding NtrC family response regulator